MTSPAGVLSAILPDPFSPTFASNGATAMAVRGLSRSTLPLTGSNGSTNTLTPPIRSPGSLPAPLRALPRFFGAWTPSYGIPIVAVLSATSRATSWRRLTPSMTAIPAPMPGATIILHLVAITTLILPLVGSIGFTSTHGLLTPLLVMIPRLLRVFLRSFGSLTRSSMTLVEVVLSVMFLAMFFLLLSLILLCLQRAFLTCSVSLMLCLILLVLLIYQRLISFSVC